MNIFMVSYQVNILSEERWIERAQEICWDRHESLDTARNVFRRGFESHYLMTLEHPRCPADSQSLAAAAQRGEREKESFF